MQRPVRVAAAGAALAVVALVWAAAAAYRLRCWSTGALDLRWDAFARRDAGVAGRHLSALLGVLGGPGVPAVAVAVGLLWLVHRRLGRRWAVAAGATIVVSGLQVLAMKLVAARAAPGQVGGWHESFPSGHVANAAVTAVLVSALLLRGRWRVLPLLWPVLMAWSRTVEHAHWLSDVIAGVAVGTADGVLGLVVAGALLGAGARIRRDVATLLVEEPLEGARTAADPWTAGRSGV